LKDFEKGPYLNIGWVCSNAGLQDVKPLLETPGVEQTHGYVVADHLAHLNSRKSYPLSNDFKIQNV